MNGTKPQMTGHRMMLASYNVLSSHLAAPNYFCHCKPENLDQATRLERVKEKLIPYTSQQAVVCLQEVSMLWSGHLHQWFESKGYYFVDSLYGSAYSNYMGVGIAFPMNKYKLTNADISKVADTKPWPRPPKRRQLEDIPILGVALKPVLRATKWLLGGLQGFFSYFLSFVVTKSKNDMDEWTYSKGRNNRMITLQLVPKDGGSTITVATYHMPCAYWAPAVMSIHSALAIQHAQKIADGGPLIVAGDWNFKPYDAPYKMITEGTMPTGVDAPSYKSHDPWRLKGSKGFETMRSAYKIANGEEPDFTNFAQTCHDTEPFIETLDYIFVSPSLTVNSVAKLPAKGAVPGPFPTESEPSDHILVSADITVNGK